MKHIWPEGFWLRKGMPKWDLPAMWRSNYFPWYKLPYVPSPTSVLLFFFFNLLFLLRSWFMYTLRVRRVNFVCWSMDNQKTDFTRTPRELIKHISGPTFKDFEWVSESRSCDPMDYTVHGILQASMLEWGAFPFSRRSSQPRSPSLQVGSLQAEPQGKPSKVLIKFKWSELEISGHF